jgi:hypothetical protein
MRRHVNNIDFLASPVGIFLKYRQIASVHTISSLRFHINILDLHFDTLICFTLNSTRWLQMRFWNKSMDSKLF